MRTRFSLANFIITLFLAVLALLAFFPFYQTLMLSFSTVADAGSTKLFLYPSSFELSSYKYLFNEGKVTRGLYISLFVTVIGTILSLIVSTAGAYALSKKTMPGRNLIFNCMIFTIFFSGGLIPFFLTMQKLHLQNSLLIMIFPLAVNTFYVILMKNFFNSIEPSMEESAKIDGASDITILVRIIVPVSMPIIATIILFYAVDRWNEWWLPTLFINDTKLYPLQVVLRNALTNIGGIVSSTTGSQLAKSTQNIYGDSVRSALIVISSVPIILIYPFIQRHFAKGILVGSVKG